MGRMYVPKKITLAALIALTLLGGGVVISLTPHGDEPRPLSDEGEDGYVITRTAGGWSPEELVVPLNASVTFATELSLEHWPASNVHPTHDIYPEFDPLRPLSPGETWSFTFTKEGRFHFHDHLAANAAGVVEVVGTRAGRQPKRLHDCEPIPREEKQQCWDDLLAYTLKERGFSKAFSLFGELYRTEPEVPKGCHGWGHALGRAAYEIYREGGDVELRPEVSYCGYGFFHGFLEQLVGERGNAKDAYVFCKEVYESSGQKMGVYNNCVHGIGHGGAADIIEDPAMWGKYQESINQGVVLCKSFTSDPKDLRNCFDGVYNELVVDMWNGAYGLSRGTLLSPDDPLSFCHNQEEDVKASCYFEYMGTFEYLFDGDFERAALYVANVISNEDHSVIAISKLAADFMQEDIVNPSYDENVRVCRLLNDPLPFWCINGMEIGLRAHGEPGKEYEKTLAFCSSELLRPDEQHSCFRRSLAHFREIYDRKLFLEACKLAPAEHRSQLCGV